MAALGTVDGNATITRGWYRVAPGRCVRPDLRGDPRRIYSYAEAVDANARAIKRGEKVLSWGGDVPLCTRDGRFELSDHKECAARGLNSAGFALIDIGTPARHHRPLQGTVAFAEFVPSHAARFRPYRLLGVRPR